MCIVQLDDYGVGFCDAKPCKALKPRLTQLFVVWGVPLQHF